MPAAVSQPLSQPARIDAEGSLVEFIAGFAHDPLGFVLAAFPWGEPGTPLADRDGPDEWQRQDLEEIGQRLRANPHMPILDAIASGHGIGKSTELAWLVLWALCTHEDTRCVITAGTEPQLRTKTVPEVGKWYRLLICKHWFEMTATAIYSKDEAHKSTWRADFIPWNKSNPEAFAGLHNQGKRILVVFDEGSQIEDIIWETTEGALTDAETEILWIVRGNPTRNTGRFRECFGRYRHRWATRHIDSRSVAITNKAQLQQWVDDYGEDSDFVRVRVKGEFPRAGSTQFIAGDIVDAAAIREIEAEHWEAVVIGVDVARFGGDESVIAVRKGRDARSMAWAMYRNKDTMFIAAEAAKFRRMYAAKAIFVDETGLGAGVVDRLRMLREPVWGVNFGEKPLGFTLADETMKVRNRRAEIWAAMRDWLRGGAIPNDPQLVADLTGTEYGYDANNAILLEKKDDMRKRGLASPDRADALALTFAMPINAMPDDDDDYDRDQSRRTSSDIGGY